MHLSLVPKPLRLRGAFQLFHLFKWGLDQVLREHVSSTARLAIWIWDLNCVIRAYGNASRESYSPFAIDSPFYLVKTFYILCIRGKIYPRNVINSIVAKTTHKLYTTGRLKSHPLPSDSSCKEVRVWINLTQMILIFCFWKMLPWQISESSYTSVTPSSQVLGNLNL